MSKLKSSAKTDLSQFFNEAFLKRKKKNEKYSMRAFARDLSLTQGRLWELIHGRYIPGPRVAERIAAVLNLTPEETQQMREFVLLAKANKSPAKKSLDMEQFAMISDWEHFAIFNLLGTENCDHNPAAIAERLGISEIRADLALGRMVEAGLLTLSESGYERTYANVSTDLEIPSSVLREAQKQILEQSMQSLMRDSVDVRSITSVTFPANVKNLPKVKKLIAEFTVRMAEVMEKGECTEVYNLAVQLVPVTVPVKQ